MLETANKGHPLTNATSSKKQFDAGDEMDTQHFNRVQDILKASPSEIEQDHIGENDIGGRKVRRSEESEDMPNFVLPEKEGDNLYSAEEQEIPSSSASDNKVVNSEYAKQKTRRRHKKTGPGKARIKMTATGPIKITRIGPKPFYLSGFASEAQKDCDAVNKYYAQWWCDDREVYRGRQERMRKK